MFNFDGKTVTLTKERTLTKRQIEKLKELSEVERKNYLKSLLGIKNVCAVNSKKGTDALAQKESGTVLGRFRRLLQNDGNINHKPFVRKKGSQWIGVEIECLFSADDYGGSSCEYCDGSGHVTCSNCDGDGHINLEDDNGNDYRVRCADCGGDGSRECGECDGSSDGEHSLHDSIREKLRRAKITNCSVKSDGSLSGDDLIGAEVTVLFDAAHGFERIEKVCALLNSMGAQVNSTCGLHVHIDMFDRTESEAIEIGKQIGLCLPVISRLVPESRRKNQYCKLSVSGTGERDCRYHAVNLTSLSKHDTVEVRLHSGTTDPKKIESWVRLLLAIVNSKRLLKEPVTKYYRFALLFKLGDDLKKYYAARFKKFNGDEAIDNDDETQGDEVATIGA